MRLALAPILAMLSATGALADCGTAYPGTQVTGTLLRAIVLDMGTDAANVTATQYDDNFVEGSAVEGVAAVIAAGNFYINLWSIPGSEAAFRNSSDCLSAGYLVNQAAWLDYDTTAASWYGGYAAETEAASYDAAALSTVTSIVPGLEVRFWDTNGDGFTDLIDADYLEGVTVDTITKNTNGTYSVYRGNIDVADKTAAEGTIFDAAKFDGTGPSIPDANFDTTIAAGDVGLFWYGSNGWAMKRAQQVTGIFVDGADHTSYNIDGTVYADALRFSRDNEPISNRPGEFTDAQKYFGLTNNTAAGLDVSLWLVPITNSTNYGAPVSLTSGSDSGTFLAKAIAFAEAEMANVTVSVDGSDVPSSQQWVNQTVYTQLESAITRANATLALPSTPSLLHDYQTYLLYLTLSGSSDDIGATFASFSFTGFVNEAQLGSA